MSDLRRVDDIAAYYDMSLPPSMFPGAPRATITGLVPNTAVVGAVPLVTINGTGFTASSVVRVDGIGVASTYVSATQLTTTGLTGKPTGSHAVTVGNPGQPWSDPKPFVVTATQAEGETTEETTAPSDTGTGTVTGGRRRTRTV